MSSEPPLGEYKDKQVEAVQVLADEGPLDYYSLQDAVGLDHDPMQAVMRGLSDNGLVTPSYDERGRRIYDTGPHAGDFVDDL